MTKKINADQTVLNQIIEDQSQQFDEGINKSDYFEVFSAEQLLKDYDLNYDDIISGVLGGGGDGGVDSCFLFVNGVLVTEDMEIPSVGRGARLELHLVQSKISPSFKEAAVKNFQDSFEDLFDVSSDIDSVKNQYSSDIVSHALNFRRVYMHIVAKKPDLFIRFYYASTGVDVHENVKKRSVKLCGKVNSIYNNADVDFEFFGAKELLIEYNRKPLTVRTFKAQSLLSASSGSYLCLVRLKDYYEFISEGGRLVRDIFESNVRDYQGNVQVNKAIRATLNNPDSDNFWFLNNGVTIITPKATAGGNIVSIEDAQIVNGLQTSNEIYNYFSEGGDVDDFREVLIRVICESDEKARDRIIKATNSQSSIPSVALRSSDDIHRNLEEFLKRYGWYYERKKNKYKNEGVSAKNIISISYLAQVVMSSLLERPDTARARPSTLVNSDAEYARVFDSNRPLAVYKTIIELAKRVEGFLRDVYSGHEGRRIINNTKYYILWWFVRQHSNGKPIDYLEGLTVDSLDDSSIQDAVTAVSSVFMKLGATDQVAKGPELLRVLKANAEE